jgi:parallel beta-helix repeat protein
MDMHARATIAALTLAAALVFAATPAFAGDGLTTVHCGQTLTHSVKLANDLTNCPGDGLVIGADGITVDLNDHTIDGTGADPTCPLVFREGINNSEYDRLTVKNGTVQQFDLGVAAGTGTGGMSDSRVQDMTLKDLGGGVSIGSGASGVTVNNRIDHNVASNISCGNALALTAGQGNRFDHNRIEHSRGGIIVGFGLLTDGNIVEDNSVADVAGTGILVVHSGAARVERNDLRNIGSDDEGCLPLNLCIGIDIEGVSSNTVVEGNTITRAQHAGIQMDTSFDFGATQAMTDVRVSDNTLTSTGDGIWLIDTDRDVVTRNTITGAGSFGSPSAFGLGVLLNGVSGTRVSRNTITGGGRTIAPGILVGLPPEFNPSSRPVAGNLIVRNTVSGQHADGILVSPVAADTTIARNTTNGNANDGIHVAGSGTTITRNTADDNAVFGIEVVPGVTVTDGGHNEASGNGGPAQCTGVACS